MKRFEYEVAAGTEYYVLAVWYDLEHHAWGGPDQEFEAVLGSPDGAGTGFGQRDMDWVSGTWTGLSLTKSPLR